MPKAQDDVVVEHPTKRRVKRPHWKEMYKNLKAHADEVEQELLHLKKTGGTSGEAILRARAEGFQAGVTAAIQSMTN